MDKIRGWCLWGGCFQSKKVVVVIYTDFKGRRDAKHREKQQREIKMHAA